MKKFIFYFVILTCMLALSCCHDDAEVKVTPERLLTKVEENGITVLELTFDDKKRLTRLNDYTNSDFPSYVLFDYGTQGITEARYYNADDDLDNKSVFTRDNLGRITLVENYGPQSNFHKLINKSAFIYDNSGRVLSREYIYEDDLVKALEEFTYDADGRLIKSVMTYDPDQPTEYVMSVTEFEYGTESIYSHWNSFFFLLNVAGAENPVLEMFVKNAHHTSFNNDPEVVDEYRIDATLQQVDAHGYLTAQVITQQNLHKREPEIIRHMNYYFTE